MADVVIEPHQNCDQPKARNVQFDPQCISILIFQDCLFGTIQWMNHPWQSLWVQEKFSVVRIPGVALL